MSFIRSTTFVTSASPDYISGDAVGAPKEFPNFFDTLTHARDIQTLTLLDKAGQGPILNVFLFKTNALTGTYTDNSAVSISDQDLGRCVGSAKIAAADWATAGGKSVVTVRPEMVAGDETNDYESLFVVVVAGGGYNAASTSDLTIRVGVED